MNSTKQPAIWPLHLPLCNLCMQILNIIWFISKVTIITTKQEARLELELSQERLAAATRELEAAGGGDEAAALRRARADLERRVRDQEEELDELAGQIQVPLLDCWIVYQREEIKILN